MIDLPDGLLSYLQSEETRSLDESLNEERKIAIDFYHGRPMGNEVTGRSQLVTRDVAEVVDYMVRAVQRMMVAEKVVEFEARRADEVEQAADLTELVAWQFMRQQSGYRIIHDSLKAGLLEKTGVLKTWAEPSFEIRDDVATAEMVDGDDSIIAAEPLEGQFDADPVTGVLTQLYQVRRKVPGKPKFRDAAVPNEEFRFSPEARCLDDAAYVLHRARRTLASIMADFDMLIEQVETLWDGSNDAQSLSDARDGARGRKDSETSHARGVSRQVWLNEEYVRWDWNGDGAEELLCVHRVGQHVVSAVEVDEQPFVIWSPYPEAHRIVGGSLADKVLDIQVIRTTLLRAAMDALYFANTPRIAVDMGNADENTLDDILVTVPGAPIRYRGTPPTPIAMPFAAPHAFTALEFMTGERESRTGITRHNQGTSADSLNKTATGFIAQLQQGAEGEEFIGRNFAECVSELFEKKARLMRKHGMVESVRVGGEFKQVDASQAPEDMDMAIRVGLGTGSKDKRLQARFAILDIQKEAKAIGSPLVDDEKLYNSAAGIIADSSMGDANQFFNDPKQAGDQPPAEPQKDPATIEAEGKVQLAQQQQQFEQAKAAAQMDADRQKNEAQVNAMREKATLEAQLAHDKADFEADLANRKFAAEMDLAERKMLAELTMRQNIGDSSIPQNRPGGDLTL